MNCLQVKSADLKLSVSEFTIDLICNRLPILQDIIIQSIVHFTIDFSRLPESLYGLKIEY